MNHLKVLEKSEAKILIEISVSFQNGWEDTIAEFSQATFRISKWKRINLPI